MGTISHIMNIVNESQFTHKSVHIFMWYLPLLRKEKLEKGEHHKISFLHSKWWKDSSKCGKVGTCCATIPVATVKCLIICKTFVRQF